ncbi:Formyl transferase [Desulfacinum hydrothermale DSM 13146]|uniref:phosphoribosylglycinamide formyltransferase 1 n=1 Tax=Desulfacinum hydrothermale DSM 13146 TaxID=1121390 RepID=A0A1W1XQR8_9BACT|nr:formyl transferase [Desulfacinum hydrothermale]SMC26330.1 Formyl transferase [Desulfacinum hydrothermale DSM 13146]
MSRLRIMILCGRSPRHLHVANRLCRAAEPLAIVQETGSQIQTEKLRKWARNPRLLWQKGWRWIRDRRRYGGGKEAAFFFPHGQPRLERPDRLHQVPHINHPRVLDLVDRLDPDLITVFGTSLIRDPLLGRGRLGMVNLHGGLSPHYRGADGTFWALYHEEPHRVGCTIHFIDTGIDTGRLIAHVCPEVREGDDELTLFWRGVRDSAEVYAELLDRLERGERLGAVQGERGRLFQVKDRMWRHERELERKMRQGLLRGVGLPRRVTWYSAEGTPMVEGVP